MSEALSRSLRSRFWPWLVLAVAASVAIWHAVDFPDDRDPEFPSVVRPTFSRRPPPAYRLAEPGDTIDRVAVYVSAAAIVLSLAGCALSRREPGCWPQALALSLAALWHAATPGPTFDGWHGLGWRVILDASAPVALRLGVAVAAAAVALIVLRPLFAGRARLAELVAAGRSAGINGLLTAAALLVVFRQFEIPGVEPVGYWPRWAYTIGLMAFGLALVRALPSVRLRPWPLHAAAVVAGCCAWFALVVSGIGLTWYHRPLSRLRTVVPGKIYISAMPTARGLEVAQRRHGFKTIINLFPEDTPLRSPRLPEELKFAREHGIRYVGSPSGEDGSGEFLDQTLALAQDPAAWPILVHCHGCMDRTPAWMGIYRFVVQGRPLNEILQEIERHRGYRPKASVTLLYNRVLPPRAPERYASDPTARLLQECALSVYNPALVARRKAALRANQEGPPRVSRSSGSLAQ